MNLGQKLQEGVQICNPEANSLHSQLFAGLNSKPSRNGFDICFRHDMAGGYCGMYDVVSAEVKTGERRAEERKRFQVQGAGMGGGKMVTCRFLLHVTVCS